MTLGWILIIGIFLTALWVALDFARFAKARKAEAKAAPDGYKTDAGGVLFVQGNATYYTLPRGERRKIADFAMDLTPGSPDMQRFQAIMAEAKRQHENEKSNARKAAITTMHEVAKEAVKDE